MTAPVLPMRPGYSPRRWQIEVLTAVLTAWMPREQLGLFG